MWQSNKNEQKFWVDTHRRCMSKKNKEAQYNLSIGECKSKPLLDYNIYQLEWPKF